jgi:hypothetical protein
VNRHAKSKGQRAKGKPAWLLAGILFLIPGIRAEEFKWRKEANRAFGVGETILYVIKYGMVSAGRATMEVISMDTVNGRPAFHLMSRARTSKPMDVVFKVRDQNESWVDAESLCSLRFSQVIREGLYRKEVRTEFDHPGGRFIYWKRRKGKEKTEEGGVPAFVQDVLSSLYFIRTRDLRVGTDISLDANSGANTWPLVVHVNEIETIKVPAGKFECFHLEPILAGEGIFQQKGRLEVWVTNDARKIPVLLRSRVMVGAFDAEMVQYSPTAIPLPFEMDDFGPEGDGLSENAGK